MKIAGKEYPISIYKHETANRWLITFDRVPGQIIQPFNVHKDKNMKFGIEFHNSTEYMPREIQTTALARRYNRRSFNSVNDEIRNRIAIHLFQMGYDEPLNMINFKKMQKKSYMAIDTAL